MYGPKEKGFWSNTSQDNWKFLTRGKIYTVLREFHDFDKVLHPVGESWTFAGSSFLPYENGLSLFVQNNKGEWHIRMQLEKDEQKEVNDHLEKYIQPLSHS